MNLKFTPRVGEGELCYRKASFLWNSDNLGEVRIEFFSEIEIALWNSISSDEKLSF